MKANVSKEALEQAVFIVMKEREDAFREFLKRLDELEKEYENYKGKPIEFFIQMACKERNIPLELEHRLIPDFIWFVEKCIIEIKRAWLWDFHKLFFLFWKYYQIYFSIIKEDMDIF